MTRTEKIDLLENYSTFLAANGYMDEDWRSEPPYAIDEFLKLTAPSEVVAKEEAIEDIFRKHMAIAEGKNCTDEHWAECKKEKAFQAIYNAMQEFAHQESQKYRQEAIQECIDKVCEWVEFAKCEFLKEELESLKKKAP